jgi:nucleoside-diphosphate-sugar epimerase
MKVVLTGGTGFAGAAILSRLIKNPNVTQVTCLTRRVVGVRAAKMTEILHSDFTRYDDDMLDRLADHSACIWALGGKASDVATPEAFAQVTHAFTLAFAIGVAAHGRRPFTFCYLSGMGADPSETSWLPWQKATRHLKGRTERDLATLQERNALFCAHSFRPGGILPETSGRFFRRALAPIAVGVGELADAMIACAIDPTLFRLRPTILNGDIQRMAGGGPL